MGSRPDGSPRRWLHREEVDHVATHGHVATPEELEERRRQYEDIVRHYDDGTPYTAAEHDIKKDPDAERRRHRLAAFTGQDPDYVEPLPPVEVWAHDFDPAEFAPRSGIRQVINLIPKQGWDLISVKRARGPYTGSKGECLSISDTHVVKARGPARVDGGIPIAVASWRDGKFDFAFVGSIKGGLLEPRKVDATTMKNWIKGIE